MFVGANILESLKHLVTKKSKLILLLRKYQKGGKNLSRPQFVLLASALLDWYMYFVLFYFTLLAGPQGQSHRNNVSQLPWARIT